MPEGRLSECAKVAILPAADIGGTNSAAVDATNWGAWHDMKDYEQVYAKVVLGTWNAADDLDTCKLQQANTAAGGTPKDLTTSASGGDYDTDNPVDAAGNTVVLEARQADLDTENGYRWVRVYCAETGNSGTDNVDGVLILHCAKSQYAQREAAASTGAVVYVTPS